MGIFDSIKNALGKGEPEPDVTVSPSQVLREAGIDPSRLKFGFGTGSIAVSGEVADEATRGKVVELLSAIKGIDDVQDRMTVAPPEPPPAPQAEAPAKPEAAAEEPSGDDAAEAGRSYTVVAGDTLWKIAEREYGNGAQYMKIFEANTDILENPDRIFPGQVLKIPD